MVNYYSTIITGDSITAAAYTNIVVWTPAIRCHAACEQQQSKNRQNHFYHHPRTGLNKVYDCAQKNKNIRS
jgi:hypothetical protein